MNPDQRSQEKERVMVCSPRPGTGRKDIIRGVAEDNDLPAPRGAEEVDDPGCGEPP